MSAPVRLRVLSALSENNAEDARGSSRKRRSEEGGDGPDPTVLRRQQALALQRRTKRLDAGYGSALGPCSALGDVCVWCRPARCASGASAVLWWLWRLWWTTAALSTCVQGYLG